MTEMFGEAWSPMSVPDLAPDDDDIVYLNASSKRQLKNIIWFNFLTKISYYWESYAITYSY